MPVAVTFKYVVIMSNISTLALSTGGYGIRLKSMVEDESLMVVIHHQLAPETILTD